MFLADGTTALGDFGLASSPDITTNFTVSPGGTFGYAAPEIRAGDPYTQACDIYSAGATWFHLLTARHPKGFTAPLEVGAVQSDANAEAIAAIRAMTALDPAERPTAAELLQRLEAALAGKDERLPVQPPTVKTTKWGAAAAAGGAIVVPLLLLLAVLGVGYAIYRVTRKVV